MTQGRIIPRRSLNFLLFRYPVTLDDLIYSLCVSKRKVIGERKVVIEGNARFTSKTNWDGYMLNATAYIDNQGGLELYEQKEIGQIILYSKFYCWKMPGIAEKDKILTDVKNIVVLAKSRLRKAGIKTYSEIRWQSPYAR
jgi:hypothetical protein